MNLLLNAVITAAGILALAELLPRAGFPAVLLERRGVGEGGRWGSRLLCGMAVIGTAFLGMAAAGLFFPLPLSLLALGLAAVGSRGAWAWPRVFALVRGMRSPGRAGLAVLALAGVPVVVGMLLPSFEQDSYAYHLGVSWGYLQAHRLVTDFIPHTTHQPLLFDIAGTMAHLVRDERLLQWMVGVSFLAAAAVFVGGRALAGWPAVLALCLPFVSPHFFPLLASGKNDVAAAALFVAGATVWGRRGSAMGALLLGLSVAAKFVYGPMVVLWVLAFPPRSCSVPMAILLLALPGVPWLAKTWLATGNPLYPFGWRLVPSLGWGPENQVAMDAYSAAFFDPGTLRLRDVPVTWVKHLFREAPHHLLVIPLLVAFSGDRFRALALSVGQMVTLAAGHITRFLLPSGWLIDLLAAGNLGLLHGRRAAALAGLLAVVSLARLQQYARPVLYRAPDLLMSVDEARAFRLPTYEEANRAVARTAPRRILCIGELRTFRIPGRCVFGGAMGETPAMWKLARESSSPAVFARKIRQMGTNEALYNLVGAVWVADRYLKFEWNDRDLAVYQGFLASYCPKVERISRVDESSGGFYLYSFARIPVKAVRESRWFLPGSENVNAIGLLYERRLQFIEGTQAYLAGLARIPNVGQARNLVGHGYLRLRNVAEADRYLAPFAREGMADLVNLLEYATVLMEQGKFPEAVAQFEACQEVYPGQRDPLDINLSWSYCQLAFSRLTKGDEATAISLVEKAEKLAFRPGVMATGTYAASRRMSKSMVLGTRAELAWRRGDREEAGKLYRAALEMDPGGKLESHWQSRLAALEGKPNPAASVFGK
jgi:hypothetical protein